MNNFFTYILGPFRNASPVSTLNMQKVKSITNLAGASTIVNRVAVHSRSKRPATENEMAALA